MQSDDINVVVFSYYALASDWNSRGQVVMVCCFRVSCLSLFCLYFPSCSCFPDFFVFSRFLSVSRYDVMSPALKSSPLCSSLHLSVFGSCLIALFVP